MNRDSQDSARQLRALGLLIAAQSLVTLLAGANLAIAWTRTSLPAGEFVRWREIFSLLLITPGAAALSFLVVWTLERGRADARGPLALFAVAVCLLGISMGVHEPVNVLEKAGGPRLQPSLHFWDEVFSHAVFFTAFGAVSIALIWSQVRNPLAAPMSKHAMLLFTACGVIAGAGIFFTQLPARDITVDLIVMAVVVALAESLRRGRSFRRLPVNVTLEGAYLLALLALLIKQFGLAPAV